MNEDAPFPGLGPGECVLVADLGGTKTTTAWIDHTGAVRASHTEPTQAAGGPLAVLDVLRSGIAVARADAERAGAVPVAVGVGSAGVIDGGRVTSATDAIPGWAGTDIAGALADAFGLPPKVLNDVHAHALGEATRGAGSEKGSMLLVAIGTGIGGAYVAGGEVLLGARAVAGHVGHVSVPEAAGVPCSCGRTGHLEGLSSGTGILAAYRRHGHPAASTHEVFTLARQGQGLAANVIHDCAFAAGRVIGDLLNVFDVEIVVVAGGVAETGEIWWEPMRRGVQASALDLVADTPVVPAGLGPGAALIGAGLYALSSP